MTLFDRFLQKQFDFKFAVKKVKKISIKMSVLVKTTTSIIKEIKNNAKIVNICGIKYLCNYKHISSNYCLISKETSLSKILISFQNVIQNQRRNMSMCESQKQELVSVNESRRFMIDCFKAFGVPQIHAEQQADLLVAADYRGHFSHGLNRLEYYLNDLSKKSTDGAAVPKILKETPATAWVDGCNGLGAVIGNFCMDLAIKKSKTAGVGWVCVKNSNHYGMAGWYPMKAMKEGFVGISMTNTSPLMAPTRAKEAALGTNPIAVGVPAGDDHFLLDMATTAVALGKIEIQRRKGEDIPEGWAQNVEGASTTDPEQACCLMPLGGAEGNSGYKGYGLASVVDILTGVMAGANYSTKIRKWNALGCNEQADLGQMFVAINPNCFDPDFETNMCDLNSRLRNSKPIDPEMTVLVAGDKEEDNMKAVDKAGGIKYLPDQLRTCKELAQRLNVKPLSFI
ncbi:uncharacterized oxidoreductase YjmC isoform X1 [Glossina fuscipes]|uniref:Uncharacterized oxidoreductase YjmC isoform X1 n=2 Tax=Glossina fuscipes TaxID=7396 RepID=A0A9C5Z7A9_9MUSC|nr:uncharacterized oxidoreductase YjmC isoform X1 [Glossina fuscipes]